MKKFKVISSGNIHPLNSNQKYFQNDFVRMQLFALLTVMLLILVASCDTKDRYLVNFEDFVTDVEQNGVSYSEQDWEGISDEYDAFVGDYLEEYSDQLTKEDYKQIGRLKARYHKAWIKHASSQIGNAFNASSQIAAGYLEEMGNVDDMENIESSMSGSFDEFADEFDGLFE